MFFDSPEGLKRSRADLSARLHECRSARCLLPCGLLPEELEELKGFSTVVSNTTALIQGERATHGCRGGPEACRSVPQAAAAAAAAPGRTARAPTCTHCRPVRCLATCPSPPLRRVQWMSR